MPSVTPVTVLVSLLAIPTTIRLPEPVELTGIDNVTEFAELSTEEC